MAGVNVYNFYNAIGLTPGESMFSVTGGLAMIGAGLGDLKGE